MSNLEEDSPEHASHGSDDDHQVEEDHKSNNGHEDEDDDAPDEHELEHVDARVLILTFKFHDLGQVNNGRSLDMETDQVEEVFTHLGYTVSQFQIPMSNSLERLQQKLREFFDGVNARHLRIVYYHGHAGLQGNSLVFFSHNYPTRVGNHDETLRDVWEGLESLSVSRQDLRSNGFIQRFQPIAHVAWREIDHLIIPPPCHTLVILDCCQAGLASVSELSTSFNYDENDHDTWHACRKELIGSASWGHSTMDRMTPAMCEVLKNFLANPGDTMSGPTLVRGINNQLARYFIEAEEEEEEATVAQAVHFLFQSSQDPDPLRIQNRT